MTNEQFIPYITYMQYVNKENLIKVGNRIKALRMLKNKSLNDFVMRRGYLTTATWSRVENGLFDFKFSTLLKISKMLDIDVSDLLKDCDFDYNFSED